MIVLGIETATEQSGCALGGMKGILASFHVANGRRHAETLAPAIEFTCRQARVALAEVSVIAVDVGPGLFTGLRVGVATAKAMAQGLRIPMIGLSSLDLLAFAVHRTSRLIVAVIDARRGEVFSALYRSVPGGAQRLEPPRVSSPEDVASELMARNEESLLVGDGALRYADAFADVGAVEIGETSLAHPSASALVELAHPQALREEFVPYWELQPTYLRKSDAELNWERRASA
ncbi:MAG: tRNA (adenosine(37)-N6)-threonylcarbamoyltransferase complex dimerization subunit type 1 TsaB [Actinomycetota bacterium]|nr:tRNA (adenosine(37)-N6)-threonylcarbamoyltransferase complex dimerization subunit type 1 TsaB [Actinomycetota bacterium]